MRKIVLCLLILVVFVFTPIRNCFGENIFEDQSVSIEADDENYSFTLIREISTITGQYVHTDAISFSYSILCIDSLARTIETYEGSGKISSGENETVIDVREIAEEMKDNYLANSYEIKIEMDVTKMDNAVCYSTGRITLSIEDILIPGSQEYLDYIESMITGGQTYPSDYEDPGDEYPDDEHPDDEYPDDEYADDEYPDDEYPDDEYPEGNSGIANGIAEAANENIPGGLVNILSTVKTVLYIAGAAIIIGAVITVIVVSKNKKR